MEEVARFGTASIAQVAKLLSRDEEQVAAEAIRLAGEGSAVRGWLTADAVAALVRDVEPERPLTEAVPLIVNAFRQARENAKFDWNSMAVPVLKNRLLQLSAQTFLESAFGSPNIWHFVTLFPDVLKADGLRPVERIHLVDPSIVEVGEVEGPASLDPVGKGRIRVDLWRAIFDYSAGKAYVWDDAMGRARISDGSRESLPIIPTLRAEDLRRLRLEFVQTLEAVSEHDAQRLDEWAAGAGATAGLPRTFRGLWNAHLKSHAANRLRAFFISEGLDVPFDILERGSIPAEPETDIEQARRLAHRYIDAMTGDELTRLSIEMAVVMRVSVHESPLS